MEDHALVQGPGRSSLSNSQLEEIGTQYKQRTGSVSCDRAWGKGSARRTSEHVAQGNWNIHLQNYYSHRNSMQFQLTTAFIRLAQGVVGTI